MTSSTPTCLQKESFMASIFLMFRWLRLKYVIFQTSEEIKGQKDLQTFSIINY
jgi:hypothetical protein